MPDPAVTISAIALAVTILLALVGIIVSMIRWQAKQDVHSRNHQKGIDDINEHLKTLNSQVVKNQTDIARMQGPSP